MGKKSKTKGGRVEREMVNLIKERGYPASRVPLSGAMGQAYSRAKDDIDIGERLQLEVKARATGWSLIYRWLQIGKKEAPDALVLKADRKPPLIVIPLEQFLDVVDEWAEMKRFAR